MAVCNGCRAYSWLKAEKESKCRLEYKIVKKNGRATLVVNYESAENCLNPKTEAEYVTAKAKRIAEGVTILPVRYDAQGKLVTEVVELAPRPVVKEKKVVTRKPRTSKKAGKVTTETPEKKTRKPRTVKPKTEAPVVKAETPVAEKPKRVRRTKAQIEADKAKEK